MKNEKSNMANGKSRLPVSRGLRVGSPRDFPYIIFHLRFFIDTLSIAAFLGDRMPPAGALTHPLPEGEG
jgi:hypothetical protein